MTGQERDELRLPDEFSPAMQLARMANQRTARAEKAAAGAIEHLMGYVRATNHWFKTAADEDSTREQRIDALEALRVAHNTALDWAKAESARIHERRSS